MMVDSSPEEQAFDLIIFDTAPTGHTIRLLELPLEWSRSIDAAAEGSGQTCIGPVAAIQDAKHKYERALAIMRDPAQTTFIFVLHPEATAIQETRRAAGELGKLGIHTQQLIINGLIPPEETTNQLFGARAEMQTRYLKQIQSDLPIPARRMVLLPWEIKGLDRLREVGKNFFDGQSKWRISSAPDLEAKQEHPVSRPPSTSTIVERILPNAHRRTMFFAGKGGVGKTVASCLTAVWLSEQGYRTLLVTTDPAAHLGAVLGVPVGDEVGEVNGLENLWAAKIDPKASAIDYKDRILEDAQRRNRPPEAIRVMAEELDSPCTEEIAAFDRFIEYASADSWEAVVFDTAPTGHTLRLLELPMDWSKQIDVKVFASVDTAAADDVAKQRFGQVIEMMRDRTHCTFSFVMYPESTPILEAYRAVQELRTVGIEPGLVVANFVIPPEQATTPFIKARRAMQEKYLGEIEGRFDVPIVQIPLLDREVRGLEMLIELGRQVYGTGASQPPAPELAEDNINRIREKEIGYTPSRVPGHAQESTPHD